MQELETEVLAYESIKDDLARTEQLEEARERLEDELRFYQQRFKELSRGLDGKHDGKNVSHPATEQEAERGRVKRGVERIRGRLRLVDAELTTLENRTDDRFHKYWGSLLKEANEQSSFGAQVEEYACVYTSRVSNLLAYSPQQYFRSPRDVMAHEIGE
jgi:5'-nucleotidase